MANCLNIIITVVRYAKYLLFQQCNQQSFESRNYYTEPKYNSNTFDFYLHLLSFEPTPAK